MTEHTKKTHRNEPNPKTDNFYKRNFKALKKKGMKTVDGGKTTPHACRYWKQSAESTQLPPRPPKKNTLQRKPTPQLTWKHKRSRTACAILSRQSRGRGVIVTAREPQWQSLHGDGMHGKVATEDPGTSPHTTAV